MYAVLRYGELRALRWAEVDFDAGPIHVARSWDQKAGAIDVKSDAGRRMIAAGLNLKQISFHTGHTGIKTTLNIYGHLLSGAAERVVERLDGYLAAAGQRRPGT